jgi:hypothetical protein
MGRLKKMPHEGEREIATGKEYLRKKSEYLNMKEGDNGIV